MTRYFTLFILKIYIIHFCVKKYEEKLRLFENQKELVIIEKALLWLWCVELKFTSHISRLIVCKPLLRVAETQLRYFWRLSFCYKPTHGFRE